MSKANKVKVITETLNESELTEHRDELFELCGLVAGLRTVLMSARGDAAGRELADAINWDDLLFLGDLAGRTAARCSDRAERFATAVAVQNIEAKRNGSGDPEKGPPRP